MAESNEEKIKRLEQELKNEEKIKRLEQELKNEEKIKRLEQELKIKELEKKLEKPVPPPKFEDMTQEERDEAMQNTMNDLYDTFYPFLVIIWIALAISTFGLWIPIYYGSKYIINKLRGPDPPQTPLV